MTNKSIEPSTQCSECGTPFNDHGTDNDLLICILKTLQSMKKQEYDYWETWKKAKSKESS